MSKTLTARGGGAYSWHRDDEGVTLFSKVTEGTAGTVGRTLHMELNPASIELLLIQLATRPHWRARLRAVIDTADRIVAERDDPATGIGYRIALSDDYMSSTLLNELRKGGGHA